MTLSSALCAAANALDTNVDELQRLDAIAGDGDLGITAGKIAKAIQDAAAVDGQDAATLLATCGKNIALTAASSCGTLVASAFLSASKAVGIGDSREQIAAGLNGALEGILKRGKANRGDRTMIDSLAPAADAAQFMADAYTWEQYLGNISKATEDGMEATKSMVPKIGRARTQPERAKGNADPGAMLVYVALTAACDAAKGMKA